MVYLKVSLTTLLRTNNVLIRHGWLAPLITAFGRLKMRWNIYSQQDPGSKVKNLTLFRHNPRNRFRFLVCVIRRYRTLPHSKYQNPKEAGEKSPTFYSSDH